MQKLLILVVLFSLKTWALEVDERLTLRILKVSSSGKTVLINRGIEDGLVKGDHAKFFLSIGVVARGVLIKASPTRSVWSLYRLVNADPIAVDSVMRLKITPAVKITEDETKMIAVDDTPPITIGTDPRRLGIPLEKGADDLKDEDFARMSSADILRPDLMSLKNKAYELWASIGFEMASSTAIPDITSRGNQEGNTTWSNITLGGEYYFTKEGGLLSKISLAPFLRLSSNNTLGLDDSRGTKTQDKTTQFGLGLHYYPFAKNYLVGSFIPFFNFSFAFSSSSISVDDGTILRKANGTGNAFSVGGGFKLYTSKGYGMRAVLEYFREAENLTDDSLSKVQWTRTSAGPRLFAAVSYRF